MVRERAVRAIERAEGGHGCQWSCCGVDGGGELLLLLLFDPLMIILVLLCS